MKWSVQKALGLSNDEAHAAEVRAARIEETQRPDGAVEYVPETAEYATAHLLGRKTLARLGINWRDIANG